MSEPAKHNYCVVVPAYQEAGRIGGVVAGVQEHTREIVVVDDGSTDSTAEEAAGAGAFVIKNECNMGKGRAVSRGLSHAREAGYEFVITMDADGQHAPGDIPCFVAEYTRSGTPVIIGNRMHDSAAMPFVRRQTNRFMSWLLSRKAHQRIPDSQCGFRLYRCDVVHFVDTESDGFAAESEVLLRLAAAGVAIGAVPIEVIYRDEKSKINPVTDTIRFFAMLRKSGR